ncbi:MAG TPA: hypothetical protein VGN42_22020 [Pirellulales bacterium]|nr:hypothetical protein [Pirellulales bacterium]
MDLSANDPMSEVKFVKVRPSNNPVFGVEIAADRADDDRASEVWDSEEKFCP